jgi:hypothetical protein
VGPNARDGGRLMGRSAKLQGTSPFGSFREGGKEEGKEGGRGSCEFLSFLSFQG